jgi:hypothetical protein
MSQAGYTPISNYSSSTASAVPLAANLVQGELAINTADGKLFYKDSAGVVQTIAYKNVPLSTVTGTLPIANGGTGTTSTTFANLTTNVTGTLPIANGGTNATATPTAGAVPYGTGTAYAFTSAGTAGQVLTSNGVSAPTWSTPAGMTYPGAGIANSTGSAWGTSYTTSGSGTVVALNNTPTLTNPTITNYTETTVTANTSTAYTIDNTNGTLQILTLTGNCTFTFPTATAGKSFTMFLKQDATGSRTVTWPASVKWPGGTAPTITATASKADKYVFTADGSSWVGSNAGQNYTL